MSLTEQRERFCRAYVANGGNATQAAITAGYSKKSAEAQGSRLLRNDKVRDFIDSLKKPVQESLGITAEWIRQQLKIEAVGGGEDTNPSARIRALELLGKDVGMFSDNVKDGTGRMPIPPQVELRHEDARDDNARTEHSAMEGTDEPE